MPIHRLCTVMAILCLSTGLHAAEIELWHINDLFSASRREDDLYTATIGIGGTAKGWNIALEEHLFTDKAADIRHDETFLTVARELLPADAKWRVRAELGIAHIGTGIFGEEFQNVIHDILNEPELILPYSTDERTHLYVNVRAARTVVRLRRFSLAPEVELESAGFKRHARLVARADWDLGEGVGILFEGGQRWTESDYPTLTPWIDPSDMAIAVGLTYKRYLELRWTANYFGVADRHWHVVGRFEVNSKKERRPAAD